MVVKIDWNTTYQAIYGFYLMQNVNYLSKEYVQPFKFWRENPRWRLIPKNLKWQKSYFCSHQVKPDSAFISYRAKCFLTHKCSKIVWKTTVKAKFWKFKFENYQISMSCRLASKWPKITKFKNVIDMSDKNRLHFYISLIFGHLEAREEAVR
jgi:hypothetical protein